MGTRQIIVALALTMLTPAAALACSPDPDQPIPSNRDLYAAAKLVVLAHITNVKEVSPPDVAAGNGGLLIGTFRPIEVFKGDLPANLSVRSEIFLPGNCMLPLLAGADYLFFLDGKDNYLTWPTGSIGFGNVESAEARSQIEAIRALKKQSP